ncbi:MATE family efflux transporter [Saccharicrinis fermentans]|uniref:Polysaccharide biosynthesis protein n=1 Tax=Saccharicrinis fermentans DSM 9555 = JCM 21142 TaxID=869213 RepID=W7Y2L4_9BACT|nr:polysaccharide biosynthesis C-terminal domain-containing protein [Saccharicrinis fermentans]GAF01798.1 polysaccharide biosynthesis protein [Saccharicrinis fermentans DSM 9555 = JCM 21142]
MGKFKSLAGDTIVYGGSTILVRLLNWLLMPYYIRTMDGIQYGIVTQLYSYIAILLVILTYGFETSFFRFAKTKNYSSVFTTAIGSIFSTSLLFLWFVVIFKDSFSAWLSNGIPAKLVVIVALIVIIDAISSLIFAKIRYEGKSVRFGLLKLLNVLILISFNLFFLYWCPQNYGSNFFRLLDWYAFSDDQAFFVLLSNLFASFSILVVILPDVFNCIGKLDFRLLLNMYKYSFPILIVGITGMINIQIDKILIPKLVGGDEGLRQLAIYGANFKIGVLMAMFTQSFRLAFEPFFFKNHADNKRPGMYSDILKFFTLFGLLIFLGVTFFMDFINIVLTEEYEQGNVIIPIVLVAQLLSGIYFTLSVWYKVTDNTKYGAFMGIVGSIITVSLNFILIPVIGYIGAALASLICFAVMVGLSIYWGNKHSNIRYNWWPILRYIALAAVIYVTGIYILPLINIYKSDFSILWYDILLYGVRIGLIIVFLGFVYLKEFKKKLI